MKRKVFFNSRYAVAQACYLLYRALFKLGPRGAWQYAAAKFRASGRRDQLASIKVASDLCVSLRNCRTDLAIFEQVMLLEDCRPKTAVGRPVEYIIDAGAHIGCSSIYFALQYPRACILAVEAAASNFGQLVRNTTKISSIRPLHAAVFHRAGEVVVINPESEPWGFQVGTLPENQSAGAAVQALTIDELMIRFGFPRVDVLKLDIEGAEKEIFQSDVSSWLPRVGSIVVELHDRFKGGCSESFYRAVAGMPHELRNNLNNVVWINRSDSLRS
ncbi:MAG TPA: FkbM family methyltransferase [Opitutaceae bacterium]|nr:FkbM family methyltransferase [Opitutaceae bacterium]